jgi:hypothetical protein
VKRAALVLVLLCACKEQKPRPNATPAPAPTRTAPAASAAPRAPTPAPITVASTDAGACERLASTQSDEDSTNFSCVAVEKHTFCMDKEGRVERRARAGAPEARVVANARPGTRMAAADVAGHEVLGFLAERKTSEGLVLVAYASVDGAAPVRVSEDGAGATTVDVAPRGKGGLLAYIDARSAMAPVHARALIEKDGGLEIGKDAVVFLGGAPDPFVSGVLATGGDRAYFLLPIAKDASTFGMAIVNLHDPPRDDEPVVWSMYPNGLDPAPISATHGIEPIRVARVMPKAAGVDAARVVELGTIGKDGAFGTYGVVAEHPSITRVAVGSDPGGRIRLARGDDYFTAVDTLRCP